MASHKSSSVTIDKYELPKGRNAVGTIIAASLMVLSANRKFVDPRSFLHDQVIARSASVHRNRYRIQDAVFYTLYGLHTVGTIVFATSTAPRYNIKAFSIVWFQWLITVFLGGSFAQKHWDETVEKKELQTIKEN